MRDEFPSLEELVAMDNPNLLDIFFGDLRDCPEIRTKLSCNPKYDSSEQYIEDITKLMIVKYDNNLDLVAADIERRHLAVKNIRTHLAAKTRQFEAFRAKRALPTAAKILLCFSAPQEAIGDFEELYHNVAQKRGYKEANIWLWCQVAKSVVPFAFAAILRIIRLSHLLEWIFKPL